MTFLRRLAVVFIFATTTLGLVWPAPAEIQTGSEILWLDPAVGATLHCGNDENHLHDRSYVLPESPLTKLYDGTFQYVQRLADKLQFPFVTTSSNDKDYLSEDSILKASVRHAIKAIQSSSFVPWKLHKRNIRFEPNLAAPREYISSLQLHTKRCPNTGPFHPASFFGGDESYEILIDGNGATSVQSNSTIGMVRGLQTLQQLFFAHSSSTGAYTPFAPVKIVDRPKWAHRGLSLDIARNPFDPKDVFRTIDALSMAKMSRLHIHATDSQSWPLEIPSLPDLARKGAYHPDLVWSAASLREIQVYGASKGISVFVEIDVPGHTASVAHAYPDLIAAFDEPDWSTFAAEPLSGQMKLNHGSVDTFMTTLLDDLLPRTSPYTSLYHVGGDEVNLAAYLLDETVQSDRPASLQPLLQRFIDRVVTKSIKYGLQPIVWEEMLLDWNLTLPSAQNGETRTPTLVQVWRNSERIEEVLKRGHRAIFGDYHNWYLDCGYGGFVDPYSSGKSPPGVPKNSSGGVQSRVKKPYLDYCAPYHNWRQIYTYNPLANISLDLQGGIEGGEILLWSEQTDSNDVDSKLWPRVAAAAEVLWTGIRDESMLEDATRRLGAWRERAVVDLGIRMSPVTMTYCLMEGGCVL